MLPEDVDSYQLLFEATFLIVLLEDETKIVEVRSVPFFIEDDLVVDAGDEGFVIALANQLVQTFVAFRFIF